MEDRETFKFSGFTIEKALEKNLETAVIGVASLRQKVLEHREKASDAGTEADALRREAAKAIIAGQDNTDLQAQIKKQVQIHTEALKMADQLQGLIPDAEKGIQVAREAISERIRETLDQCRGKRTSQLERAQVQRAKSMGESRDGRMRSEPPDQPGTASLAWCERCGQPIARFDTATIRQPVSAEDFISSTPRWPYPPFRPGCEIEFFTCPTCNHRPWVEPDKILTTDGFFMVPAQVDDNQRKAS